MEGLFLHRNRQILGELKAKISMGEKAKHSDGFMVNGSDDPHHLWSG